jgi:equilibrative nucleoside transporter 1/2/3
VVFAVGILASTAVLNMRYSKPAYPSQLRLSLVVYVVVGVLLTTSTAKSFYLTSVSYFLFLQLIVLVTAAANGLSQNSAFAFAAGFGRTEYAPAIMTGEALAALLPSVIGEFA